MLKVMDRDICHYIASNAEDYNQSYPFETSYDYRDLNDWMTRHFPKAWFLTFVYVVAIHAGQHYMKNRPPYKLKSLLLLWNILLAVYSIAAFFRTFREMGRLHWRYGFHFSICDLHTLDHKNFMALYTTVFAFSKCFELGDTVFIVLRKTPLIFLHWYHHVVTLLFVWYSCVNVSSMGRWFMVVNLFVHSIMYSYYALKIIGVKLPKKISMALTSVQLLQMAAGIIMSVYAYRMSVTGVLCCVDYKMIFSGWTMYLSYFLLFLNFFIKSYFSKKRRGNLMPADSTNQKKKVH